MGGGRIIENAHALIVGIADYEKVTPLSRVVLDDARAIAELLIDTAYCGYARENVRVLLDKDATLDALRMELDALARRTDAESTVVIYFSGHGLRAAEGEHSGEYLLPVDADISTRARLAATCLRGDVFTTLLRALPAAKILVLLDCCHAGGIGEVKATDAFMLKAGLSDAYYEQLRAGRGRVIMAASREDEFSWIHGNDAHSLFTLHLLNGLQGGIVSDDGVIRVFQLYDYVRPRVRAAQPNQTPVFKADIEDNFAVALYRAGIKNSAPKDAEGFMYDAYLVYADREPDSTFVWDTLTPRLEQEGLRVAVSGDVEKPGVARIIEIENVVKQAKRVVIVLSENYVNDARSAFVDTLAQTLDVNEKTYRLLPVLMQREMPPNARAGIQMLETLQLAHPQRAAREMQRLIRALREPLPRRM